MTQLMCSVSSSFVIFPARRTIMVSGVFLATRLGCCLPIRSTEQHSVSHSSSLIPQLRSLCCADGGRFTKSASAFAFGSKRRARGPVLAAAKSEAEDGGVEEGGHFKDTVDLPKTSFGLRANSIVREPEIQKMWEEKQVMHRLSERNTGEIFTLHDGPPYANGELHMGHALNKILKDFINRYQLLQGKKVKFVPGWDCHGLPIELKVLQSMDAETRKALTPIKLRKKAAKFALKTVDQQRNSFKRFGIWADWDNPYLTLQPEYEAAQIGVFGQMILNGHIYRGKKPVHWSPSSQTALAEAELEYPEGHVSKSIYVLFKMTHLGDSFPGQLRALLPQLGVAIWTTTPWTIPGNSAVAVNDKLTYALVELKPMSTDKAEITLPRIGHGNGRLGLGLERLQVRYLVLAADLVTILQEKWKVALEVKGTFSGSALEHSRYRHPLLERESPVVIGGDYVTTESGTGLVHTAPGHGYEDYMTGQKYGLPMLSPVDDKGNFTDEAGKFAGLNVLGDGNQAVVEALDDNCALLMVESYAHKYPYDWRTKKPTIFRATEQWFASVEGFQQAALQAITEVEWFPSQGEKRITSMTAGRSDWCISRQRTWGVPIPVFYNIDTGEPLMTKKTIAHIQSVIAEKGSDAWWYMSNEDLLPESYRTESFKYRKGMDTMDVWFDSGSSWAAVVGSRDGLKLPADLYLEGSDQHRGWFQSSLLTSVASKGCAPYKRVVTHGFVLDDKGFKMSKSVGNVMDPKVIIEGGKNQKEQPGFGADVLRLWVSSVDYTGDVMVGPQIIRQMSDVYRKLRGTLRYLLSNLHNWEPENSVEYRHLPKVDQYALYQLATLVDAVTQSFDSFQFYQFFQLVQRFVVVDLSNFYFDIAKDRLYVGGTDSYTRRSCQTVLAAHLLCLARIIAPVLPHLAEDVWQHLPFSYTSYKVSSTDSVFEALWPEVEDSWRTFCREDLKFWTTLLLIRGEVNKVLEMARSGKLIGASLDAKVYIGAANLELQQGLQALSGSQGGVDNLSKVFLTSQAYVVSLDEGTALNLPYVRGSTLESYGDLWVGVSGADGAKCERCWNFTVGVGSQQGYPTLCERCYNILKHRNDTKTLVNV